jgi:dolichol kinase
MTAALCGTAFLAWFSLVEAATRRLRVSREVSRKLVHVTAGLAAAAMPAVLGFGEIAVLGVLFAAAMYASRRLGLLRSIHEVERATWGEVCLPLGVAAAAVLAPDPARYACAVAIVALSDPAACLAGRRIGGPRLPGGTKTVAGSTAFLATALAVGLALLPDRPAVMVAVAVATTLVEAASSRGLDNVTVPVTAACVLLVAGPG